MEKITEDLIGMLFGNEGLMKVFNKDSYADAFHDYYDKYTGLFDEIENVYDGSDDKEGFIKGLAVSFAEYAAGEEGKLKKRSEKEHFQVDHNSVLTVYMLPHSRKGTAKHAAGLQMR